MWGRKGRSEAGPRLELECLEERIAPAGNVNITVSGGTLTLTGDWESNSVTIDQAMLGDSQFRVTPGAGTTLNGFADPMVFSGIKGMKMSLGDGDDTVVLSGVAVVKDVQASGGSGDDTFVIAGGGLVQGSLVLSDVDHTTLSGSVVVRDAKITYSTDGEYSVVVDASRVLGNCSIANRGQDVASDYIFSGAMIYGNLALSNKIGTHGPGQVTTLSIADTSVGGISVKAGTGDYAFIFDSSMTLEHKGSISLSYGVGIVNTIFVDSTVNGAVSVKVAGGPTAIPYTTSFTIQNDSTITDKLTIKTGDSDDFVVFNEAYVVKGLNIDTGTGTTFVSMHDVGIGGERIGSKIKVYPSTISQSANGWSFDGDTTTIAIDTAEIGKLAIKLRPQDSYVSFNQAGVIAGLCVTGQGGDDLITFRGVRMPGDVAVKSGGGNDIVCFDQSDMEGSLLIDTGAGVDHVRMETDVDNAVGDYLGPVKIALGAGDDYLQIGNSEVNGNSGSFIMPLALDGGSGNDELAYLANGNAFSVSPKVAGFENTH